VDGCLRYTFSDQRFFHYDNELECAGHQRRNGHKPFSNKRHDPWTTNTASDSQVEYGLTTSYGSATTLDPAFVTLHSVAITGLTESTTYHYRVKSKDPSTNLSISGDFTVTTPDITPPVISGVVVATI